MQCPDDGVCHHDCCQSCFRVLHCGPLSGVYVDDDWPVGVKVDHRLKDAFKCTQYLFDCHS